MRQPHLVKVLFVVLLVCSLGSVRLVGAQDEDSRVNVTMTLEYQSGSQLLVHARMLVEGITVFSTRYTSDMITAISGSDAEVMGAIKLLLRNSLEEQVVASFPHADVQALALKPTYQSPYFSDDFSVNLTAAFFGLSSSVNTGTLLDGLLDAGAIVSYTFPLHATSGWNVTYTYTLPATMVLNAANTPALTDITWVLDDWDGSIPQRDAMVSVYKKEPTTPTTTQEQIALSFVLDAGSLPTVSLTSSVVIHALDITPYQVLPAFISGVQVLPADGIRLLMDNHLLLWDTLYISTIYPIEHNIQNRINTSLNQSLTFTFSWDPATTTNCSTPYDVTHMDMVPPVNGDLKDSSVGFQICGMSARAFFGLMNAGADATLAVSDITFGEVFGSLGYPYDAYLQLPANNTLSGQNRYHWNSTIPFAGTVTSDHQPSPPYQNESVESYIEIDISKMDLNIFSLLAGKTEMTASVQMEELTSWYVMHWPSEFGLSRNINLSFLNADAFRLCVEEGVFSSSEVDVFLNNQKAGFEQRILPFVAGESLTGIINQKTFRNSLAWDGDIADMSDVSPVVTAMTASEAYPVGFNMSIWPASLSIPPQQFTVSGVENQRVTYRLVFPKGMAVFAQDSLGKSILHGNTTDGREYVEVAFDAGEAGQSTVLTCTLAASPFYILAMFLPCLLVVLLVIILIVAIVLVRKKRRGFIGGGGGRKKKAKRAKEEEEVDEPEGFEGQEYYVPPPPSRRK